MYEPKYIFTETKQESMEWQSVLALQDQKFRIQKVLASVFWDSGDVTSIDYREKRKTITGKYYSQLLKKHENIWGKKTRNFRISRTVRFID